MIENEETLNESQSAPLWLDNNIQFPRLLAEIQINCNFTEDYKERLCDAMDVEWKDIENLFERAVVEFDIIKENL